MAPLRLGRAEDLEVDHFFRFSDYEIFAYLAAGLATLVACDFAFGTRWVLGANWSAADGVAIVFGAYVVGHVVAWPAAWILERRFVRYVLGAPSRALFGENLPGICNGAKRLLFPDYFTRLESAITERVRATAARTGHAGTTGESLFWIAFVEAKRDPAIYARMEQFLKLYGFCRNLAFVGLAAGIIIGGQALYIINADGLTHEGLQHLTWTGVAFGGGVAMFYRYLKFYRLYSVEVFVGYANLCCPKRGAK